LDRLRARNRDGFSFTTDFELIKDGAGHPPEIDSAVIADGRLILGETKKNDRLAGKPDGKNGARAAGYARQPKT
jgi:hypothetical protein